MASNILFNNDWVDNIARIAKAMVLLKIIIVIKKKGRNIDNRKITIEFNNKKVYKQIVKDIKKSIKYT